MFPVVALPGSSRKQKLPGKGSGLEAPGLPALSLTQLRALALPCWQQRDDKSNKAFELLKLDKQHNTPQKHEDNSTYSQLPRRSSGTDLEKTNTILFSLQNTREVY